MTQTPSLLPDPLVVCAHIKRLNRELKIARRLLRLALDARDPAPRPSTPKSHEEKSEGNAHATR